MSLLECRILTERTKVTGFAGWVMHLLALGVAVGTKLLKCSFPTEKVKVTGFDGHSIKAEVKCLLYSSTLIKGELSNFFVSHLGKDRW